MCFNILWFAKKPIQCVPQKRKPINRVNFSENCNDLSEKAYIFTKFSLSSFFWHQLQDVLAMHEQALTISNGDVKMICAEWEFKGLTGSATFQNKGTCWKTFIGISFVSFVMFLLLRLLILTWISESELGHITQHHYSAQIVFDMHEFKLFPFIHALRYIIMCSVSNERRENALDNEAYSLFQSCVAMKISHW